MTDTSHLDILPLEVLLVIFDYCDAFDLVRLSEVCKRFYEIVRSNAAWKKKNRGLLVTNQMSERFRKRCNPVLLSPRTTWLVSYNWRYGRYNKKSLISIRQNVMPLLQMTNDTLLYNAGPVLHCFKRNSKHCKLIKRRDIRYFNSIERRLYETELDNMDIDARDRLYHSSLDNKGLYQTEICKFVLCGNCIISGHSNGDIGYWIIDSYKGYPTLKRILCRVHYSDINGIDATSETVISSGADGRIKIEKHLDIDEIRIARRSDNVDFMYKKDRVQSLVINPIGTQFAIGSSGKSTDIPPLNIINIETRTRFTMFDEIQYPWRYGAGILDMVWDNPQTLLTCGYDTLIRKWDLRTRKCVGSWADPNDAALYCISSDHQYSMITGTQLTCAALLWDQRMSDFVQIYFIKPEPETVEKSYQSSPIYSLQFDSSHLYCALDRHLIELSFSDQSCKRLDYKQYYQQYR